MNVVYLLESPHRGGSKEYTQHINVSPDMWELFMFVLRFYGPVNPVDSCQARSVYLTILLLGRLSPLSG